MINDVVCVVQDLMRLKEMFPNEDDSTFQQTLSSCCCDINQAAANARRTLEETAKLSVTRECWRKLFPLVCAAVFCDFRHACHRRQIFNMLNNFGRNEIFLAVCARPEEIAQQSNELRMRIFIFSKLKMAASSSVLVAEAILEDKLADIWLDYPCLYDVRSADFKKRDLREKSFQEMAEKLGTTCKI